MESLSHGAPSNDRETCVYIDRACPRNEEVLHGEVLQVIGGQHIRHAAIHGELPAREEARIPLKEPLSLRWGRIDVPAQIAYDERVTLENGGRLAGHAGPLLRLLPRRLRRFVATTGRGGGNDRRAICCPFPSGALA